MNKLKGEAMSLQEQLDAYKARSGSRKDTAATMETGDVAMDTTSDPETDEDKIKAMKIEIISKDQLIQELRAKVG